MRSLSIAHQVLMPLSVVLCLSSCDSSLVRSDQAGITIWRTEFIGGKASPVVMGDSLYLASRDGAIRAFDSRTGKRKWLYQTGEQLPDSNIVMVPKGTDLATIDALVGQRLAKGRRSIDATPVVDDDTVYAGSNDHSFYALDAATGQKKWAFRFEYEIHTQAIVQGGTVFIAPHDGFVHALDAASGNRKWVSQTPRGPDRRPQLEFSFSGGTIYVTSIWPYSLQRGGSVIYALDPRTGRQRWLLRIDGNFPSAPVKAGELVLFSTQEANDAYLYAVDATTGKLRWQYETTSGRLSVSQPYVADDLVYFSTREKFVALDLVSGKERWSFEGDISSTPHIYADKQSIFVMSMRVTQDTKRLSTIHALDLATGREKWSKSCGSNCSMGILLVQDRALYIASGFAPDPVTALFGSTGSRRLVGIDAGSGNTMWEFEIEGGGLSRPAVMNGMLFVYSETVEYVGKSPKQGYLYAIDLARLSRAAS